MSPAIDKLTMSCMIEMGGAQALGYEPTYLKPARHVVAPAANRARSQA